jgi:8-oxo-dGTP diphosphatase
VAALTSVTATLCHLLAGGNLLLQRKSQHRFGAGKWNGVGGKSRPHETPEACVTREIFEETGLQVRALTYQGVLRFCFGSPSRVDWTVHVFSSATWSGEPHPSDEGVLRWFAIDEIPYEEMWPDNRHWLPLLFAGKRFRGWFLFNEGGDVLRAYQLTPL